MPIGVGIIGAGTVGGGVAETLLKNGSEIKDRSGLEVELKHVADLNTEALKNFERPGVTLSTSAEALINDPNVDVVCELIGGHEPAKTFMLQALNAKKHVVTANKMLVAMEGPVLCKTAAENGVHLRYEAAVAGGIPIIKALREGLAANRIESIYGILNGTCNYILSKMTYEDMDFAPVLKQAQELGFAETPPDLDVNGDDTAHKCQILASLCYSTEVDLDSIYTEGITNITHDDVANALAMGYLIKLVAVVSDLGDTIDARVHPALVPEDHLLASVRNEFNAVYVQSDICDATLYYGRGAGRFPTASAVVSDIVDIARQGNGAAEPPFRYGQRKPLRDIMEVSTRYYIRFTTADVPGVFGKVAQILGANGVSISSCNQKEHEASEGAQIVVMTHETTEAQVRTALAEIDESGVTTAETHTLRVL
jgi:homoserine dehydrogenase